jgi:serine/threonine-protein kinase RsbW
MSGRTLVELKVAPDAELLRSARLVVSSLAADRGFSLEEIEDLKLAVQEACASRLLFGLAGTAVHVTVIDEGGLTVEVFGDRSGSGEPDEDAAMGLVLAEALVDEFTVREEDGIERIVLRKAPAGA